MMDENQLPPEELIDPETGVLEDVQQEEDDDDDIVHDQLPSVEEAKANAKLEEANRNSNRSLEAGGEDVDDPAAVEKPRRSCWRICCYSCCCLCLAFVLIIVLAVAVQSPSRNSRRSGPRHKSNTEKGVQTLAPGTYEPRFNEVKDFLTGISDIDALQDENSPQYKAALWIADQDMMHLDIDDDGFLERYATATFYFAMNGPRWPLHLDFLSGKDTCKWNHVGFSNNKQPRHVGVNCKGSKHVKELFFSEKWLEGNFPPEMELLKELKYISIFQNPGIDSEFPTVLRRLPKLQYLAFHFCALSGPIPTWIGEMTSLTSLVLSNNALFGTVPDSIKKLTKLEQLFLDDQGLAGDIDLFKPLTNLRALLIEDNQFQGTLTEEMLDQWKHIEILDVSGNNLTNAGDSLPANLFTRKNLTVVDLHTNAFKGSIPDIPAKNHMMQFLALHENSLTGSIPSTIARLEKLTHLDLSMNDLGGDFPTNLGIMTELKYFFASLNSFNKGSIPAFLKELPKLEDLSLKGTNRAGTLPEWLGNMPNLTLLDLGKLH